MTKTLLSIRIDAALFCTVFMQPSVTSTRYPVCPCSFENIFLICSIAQRTNTRINYFFKSGFSNLCGHSRTVSLSYFDVWTHTHPWLYLTRNHLHSLLTFSLLQATFGLFLCLLCSFFRLSLLFTFLQFLLSLPFLLLLLILLLLKLLSSFFLFYLD